MFLTKTTKVSSDVHLSPGKLLNLQILKNKNMQLKLYSAINIQAGEFPRLKIIKMFYSDAEKLELERGAMPNLQHLNISLSSRLRHLSD